MMRLDGVLLLRCTSHGRDWAMTGCEYVVVTAFMPNYKVQELFSVHIYHNCLVLGVAEGLTAGWSVAPSRLC